MEDSNTRQRKGEDSDVEGRSDKEIKCCNITDSSKPNTKSSEHSAKSVEVSAVQKRKASDDGEAPKKKLRCSSSNNIIAVSSPTEPSTTQSTKKELKDGLAEDIKHDNPLLEEEKIFEMASSGKTSRENNMEDSNTRKRKREDNDVAGTPSKEIKCCNITDSSKPNTKSSEQSAKLVEVSSVQKRKASDDGDALKKKMRCSSSNNIVAVSSPTEPSATRFTKKELKDGLAEDIKHDNPLLEEEKIFEMASSGKTSRAEFEDTYVQLAPLGSGGFGSVYAGLRKEDRLPVAIKHIPKEKVSYARVVRNGKVFRVIVEVALMLKTAGLPGSVGQSAAVSLLDWYTLEHELILVLERPARSMDLHTYVKVNRGSLSEHQAKMILKRIVDAAVDMHAKGVFHRDIKLENILYQASLTGASRVRVIDFGCGTLSSVMPYTSFCGTPAYAPPEYFINGRYFARSCTVWQLGALFYSLLHIARFSTRVFMQGCIKINSALSQDTKTLLNMCLACDPTRRATLEELQSCPALR